MLIIDPSKRPSTHILLDNPIIKEIRNQLNQIYSKYINFNKLISSKKIHIKNNNTQIPKGNQKKTVKNIKTNENIKRKSRTMNSSRDMSNSNLDYSNKNNNNSLFKNRIEKKINLNQNQDLNQKKRENKKKKNQNKDIFFH